MSTEAQAQAAARRARAGLSPLDPPGRGGGTRFTGGGSCLVGALSCVRVLIGFGCHMRCSHNIRFHVPHIDRYRLDVTLVWTVECA
jgi:hypothetical protein